MGVKDFRYCDFDQEFSAESWKILSDSACAYLSGGFTPYFLETLKAKGVIDGLREFSATKPIIGVSAGAIIMGKDITILNESSTEGAATLALGSSAGIGLYSHHFYPHFRNSDEEIQQLLNRSDREERPIIACNDHSGLLIDGSKIQVIAEAHVFAQGTQRLVNDGALVI